MFDSLHPLSDVPVGNLFPSAPTELPSRETITVDTANSPEAEMIALEDEETDDTEEVARPRLSLVEDAYDLQERFFDGRPGFREKPRSKFARQREPKPSERSDPQQPDDKPTNGSKNPKPRYRNYPKWPARKPGSRRREAIRIARP